MAAPNAPKRVGETSWMRRLASSVGSTLNSGVVKVPVMLIGGLIATLVLMQRKILYQPVRAMEPLPSQMPEDTTVLDVFFDSSDGKRIHAWYIKSQLYTGPTILFFHGNAGNISHRWSNMLYMRHYLNNPNIMIMSYRGYGRSEGEPSERGIIDDAEAALNVLKDGESEFYAEKVVVFGRSLGAAAALGLAERRAYDLDGVILENGFTSIPDMAQVLFPWLPKFALDAMVWDSWRNIDRIKSVKSKPLLMLSSRYDEIVPRPQMEKLRDLAPSATFVSVDSHHNDAWLAKPAQYWDPLRDFLENVATSTPRD